MDVYTMNSSYGWDLSYSRHYLWDGNQLTAVLDGNNNLQQTYTYGPMGLAAVTDYSADPASPKTYIVTLDAHGNTAQLIDPGSNADPNNPVPATVVASYLYDPYGRLLSSSGPEAGICIILGKGYIVSPETPWLGLAPNPSGNGPTRVFNFNLDLFMQRDPSGEINGGLNLEQGFGGDPINKIDPSGLAPQMVTWRGVQEGQTGTFDQIIDLDDPYGPVHPIHFTPDPTVSASEMAAFQTRVSAYVTAGGTITPSQAAALPMSNAMAAHYLAATGMGSKIQTPQYVAYYINQQGQSEWDDFAKKYPGKNRYQIAQAEAESANINLAKTRLVLDNNQTITNFMHVFPLVGGLIIASGDLPLLFGQAVRPRIVPFNEATDTDYASFVKLPSKTPAEQFAHIRRVGKLLAADAEPGTYVYARDIAGRVWVVPDASGAHPSILGGTIPATGAGELTISGNRVVTIITNRSGTFQFGNETLPSVGQSIEAQGVKVAPDAIVPYR